MPTDIEIEAEIQAKGLTAPRITPTDIESAISQEYYFRADDGVFGANTERGQFPVSLPELPTSLALLTLCILVLKNGFTIVGISAYVSPENFDAELGRKIARQNAVDQIWPLEGYHLRSQLAAA